MGLLPQPPLCHPCATLDMVKPPGESAQIDLFDSRYTAG